MRETQSVDEHINSVTPHFPDTDWDANRTITKTSYLSRKSVGKYDVDSLTEIPRIKLKQILMTLWSTTE